MNDIFTYYTQLPPAVKGVVVPDANGDYTIYINSIYNHQQHLEVFNHEMRHILLGHHNQERPVQALEAEANNRSLLLQKIKQAEEQGLPLVNGVLAPQKPAAPPQSKPAPAPGRAAPAHRAGGRRPAPETPQQQQQRILAFMEKTVMPKYGKQYEWVRQLKKELGME